MSDVKDVKMYYVDSDIEKIQTKTNLFLQSYGKEGAFHLVREVIQNSIDECIDKDSPGKNILVDYDIKTDTIKVEDDGRGFPESDYPLDIFCTKLQSGSKFFRDQSGATSGEFGLGLTATCALADKFSIESFRDVEGYRHLIEFEDGKKYNDKKVKLKKSAKKRHGTIVKFKPSKKYLGPGTEIPYKEVLDWVETMSYFFPKGVKIRVSIYDGLTLKLSKKFKAQTYVDLLDKICTDKDYSYMVNFEGDDAIVEKVNTLNGKNKLVSKSIKKPIHLEVALRYQKDSANVYDSYCNYTQTKDGGVHVESFESCFCRYMAAKAKETQTEKQKEKYKILWDDVRQGLCATIVLMTSAQVGFVGNAKSKIGNEELIPHLNAIVNKGLEKFFDKHTDVLNQYVKIVKLNTKARVEMQKVKQATQKEHMNSIKELKIKNYIRCNNTGKNQFRELFITEGNSAASSASNGCDKNTQAFLLLRGVVANPLKCSLSDIMKNAEWRTFVTILRCGIGPTFDINKLYFDRINIFTDSDSDGYGISSGILVFIYTYLRPLIEAGKVYKVFSPLYRIDDKNHPFVLNKAEMVELYRKKVIKHYTVTLESGETLSKERMTEFLMDTYEYSDNLIQMANNLGHVDKYLLERIIAILVVSGLIRSRTDYDDLDTIFSKQSFIKSFMSRIQKDYPEITLNSKNNIISGIASGRYCSIKINKRFIKQAEDLIPVYRKYQYLLRVEEKVSKGKTVKSVMSIGQFLEQSSKLNAKIITRYKGLGELDAEQLHETSLDINNRVSIQYTVEDAEKETKIFRKLHGNSKKDIEARKEMMAEYKVSRDDLDN